MNCFDVKFIFVGCEIVKMMDIKCIFIEIKFNLLIVFYLSGSINFVY